MKLSAETIKQIQESDSKKSNSEVGRELGVNRETVSKYRKLKADISQQACNVLDGTEEQMRFDKKQKELEKAQLQEDMRPLKEKREDAKKLELLQSYSPADIKELLNFVAMNRKNEIDEQVGEEGHLKFGLVSDTHFGARGCAREELGEFYEKAKDKGVECFVHAGDIVDGSSVYSGQQFEQNRVGFEEQIKDIKENYPDVGLKTYFIGGNHDESYLKGGGADITKAISDVREDLVNLGFYDATLKLNGIKIQLHHGGGSCSYALDYKLNKLLDKIPGNEAPDIYALGHYHQALYALHRGIHGFMPGAFLKENLLCKRFNLGNLIGGWVIEIEKDKNGENRLNMEFLQI